MLQVSYSTRCLPWLAWRGFLAFSTSASSSSFSNADASGRSFFLLSTNMYLHRQSRLGTPVVASTEPVQSLGSGSGCQECCGQQPALHSNAAASRVWGQWQNTGSSTTAVKHLLGRESVGEKTTYVVNCHRVHHRQNSNCSAGSST